MDPKVKIVNRTVLLWVAAQHPIGGGPLVPGRQGFASREFSLARAAGWSENGPMNKRWVWFAIWGTAAGLCRVVVAQEHAAATGSFSSLAAASSQPALTLADARRFAFRSSVAWVAAAPNDFLPSWKPEGWDKDPVAVAQINRTRERPDGRARVGAADFSKDTTGANVELQKSFWNNVHGEVGFLYGRSSGRVSRDVEAGYILGTVGDEHLQISAGAFYENSNWEFPRRVR